MELFNDIPLLSELSPNARDAIARVLILIVLFALAWLLRKRIGKVLVMPLRAAVNKTKTEIDDFFFRAVDKVITYVVLAVPLAASTVLLDLAPGERAFIGNITATLLVYALFRFLFDIVTRLFVSSARLKAITGYELESALMPITQLSARVAIVTVGVLTMAQIWGWNIAGLVAGVGLGGLAISLAAKDILDDILGYAVIVADNVCRETEYIVTPDAEGIVEKIGVRSTRIRQLNQGLVTVPNAKLSHDWVVNWSRLEKRWFNFMVGITYSSTAEQIQAFVTNLSTRLKAREHVQEDSVVVLFTEYDDSSLNVLVRFYVDLPDWVEAHAERHDVNLMIMDTLNEIGLEVAFPSRSLYLEGVPTGLTQQTHNGGQAGDAGEKEAAAEKSSYPQGSNETETLAHEGLQGGDADGDED